MIREKGGQSTWAKGLWRERVAGYRCAKADVWLGNLPQPHAGTPSLLPRQQPTTASTNGGMLAGPADGERSPGAYTSSGSRVLDRVPQPASQACGPLPGPLASWPCPLLDAAEQARPRRCRCPLPLVPERARGLPQALPPPWRCSDAGAAPQPTQG